MFAFIFLSPWTRTFAQNQLLPDPPNPTSRTRGTAEFSAFAEDGPNFVFEIDTGG